MKKRVRIVAVVILALSLPFLMFCAPVQEKGKIKDGRVYGVTDGLFRAKWWNYYERGISFAEGEFRDDAAKDFRAALSQRDNDQRRARTYGMHFVDYFPHRELGIVLLGMGHIPEAIQELETSLSTEESAKAKFYLNRARKKFLISQPGQRDLIPPQILLKSSAKENFESSIKSSVNSSIMSNLTNLTNDFSINIAGEIYDKNYVSFISVNGVPRFFELAEQTIRFEQRVELVPGSNTLVVEAEDLMGNRSRSTIEVTADHRGPQLSVINFMNGQQITHSPVEITISFFDASGVDKVTLHNKEMTPGGMKRGTISTIAALQLGKNTIAMEAVDNAGNKTSGEIQLVYLGEKATYTGEKLTYTGEKLTDTGEKLTDTGEKLTDDKKKILRDSGILVAMNSMNAMDSMNAINVMNAAGEGSVATDASPFSLGTLVSEITPQAEDSYPPEIMLRGLLRAVQGNSPILMIGRQKDNRFLIEGQASDLSGIETVLVNGQPVVAAPAGKEVIFNRLVELREGDNTFDIQATDASGNSVSRKVYVQRRIQKIDMNESRMSLSIMPFKNECISPALAESVYNLFVDRVINDERFNVVGREEALDAVLKELQLSQTDLVDKEKAVKAGRLIGSETIMFGKIIETPDSVEVFVHLTDTETSRIMASHDVYDHKKGRSDIEFIMQGLSSKFIYSIPLVEGKVLASKGTKYFLDLGKKKHFNIKEGLKCIAYRSEPFIVDGMVLGEDVTILGTLLLKNVQEKIAIASLVDKKNMEEGMVINKGDKVITK